MQGTPNPNIFSVFGRFGAITAQSGDYTFAQIGSTPTTLSGYGITDAQALDADLTALAGLSTTGTIERTGDGTAATYTVTAAAKTVLDDTTTGAMLTTLGGQPLATNLTTVSGWTSDQTTRAGALPSGTSGAIEKTAANTFGTFPVTAAAKTVLDDATVGDMRTTLGLAIGTNVQAYNAALQSISGLTTTADRMIYTTASNTYAVTPLTTFGRSLVDDADAATGRTTLGATTVGANLFTLANPSAIRFPRINADNTVSALSDADARTALGIDPTYYNKSNILGTVTQSGGVPTGAVIEYGSNANGNYVKYADGTMICFFFRLQTTSTSTSNFFGSTAGSLFENSTKWTFPSVFSANPSVLAVGGRSATTAAFNAIDAQILVYFNGNQAVGVHLMAIGRWY